MEQCPECGNKYAKQPLFTDDKKPIWKNWFKIDMIQLLFIIIILFLAWQYDVQVDRIENVTTDPCGYCARSGCYDLVVSYPEPSGPVVDEKFISDNYI